ncbi:MAG: ExbD/TolR family protein [Waddliaceae bacterium]
MGRRLLRQQQQQEEEPVVNLTPLIDVVFSILIMFIVVAPLLELDNVALAVANPDTKSAGISIEESGPVTIHVHKDNTIWLNQRAVNLSQLTELLKQEKQRHPAARPQIFHDKWAHFGTYQSIKNAAESAGFEQMDIILKPA